MQAEIPSRAIDHQHKKSVPRPSLGDQERLGGDHIGGRHFPSRPSPTFFLSPPRFSPSPSSLQLHLLLLPPHSSLFTMAASNSLDHLSNRMKLEWHSKLNTEMVPAKNFRRTSIIGTIGMSNSLCSLH